MNSDTYRLVIGNKALSSWSLRPWLAMRHAAIPFSEININLRAPDKVEQIRALSPAGKVPALLVGEDVVWDSLAILEFLAERHPQCELWPARTEARAAARSVSAEMHAGFQALRETCPMDLLVRRPMPALPEAVEADVRRVVASWRFCRLRFGNDGPFLFSRFSAADAMYAPVATRFRTYLPDLRPYGDDGTGQAYVETIFALPEMAEWEEGARAEVAALAAATD